MQLDHRHDKMECYSFDITAILCSYFCIFSIILSLKLTCEEETLTLAIWEPITGYFFAFKLYTFVQDLLTGQFRMTPQTD